MKKPWLAALLNFIVPGLGYLYVDTRKAFAWLLITGVIISSLDVFNPTVADYLLKFPITPLSAVYVGCFMAAFVVDAYYEAKKINAAKEPSTKA